MRLLPMTALAAGLLAACHSTNGTAVTIPPAPGTLAYELDPSGTPATPAGILLSWSDVSDPTLSVYNVYSRPATTGAFGLRGSTTSNTFHDNGVPDLEYYVTAVDASGGESDPSNTITVDERLQLEAPDSLSSVALNGAVDLYWTDNAYATAPARFSLYRVYSSSYDLSLNRCAAVPPDTTWSLEGTTVAPAFLVGALTNGVPRCYAVSALSIEGYESLWSPLAANTPRPDARNMLLYAFEKKADSSAFRFWDDSNGDGIAQPNELGLIESDTTTADFTIHRNAADSTLWIVPVFTGTTMQLYGPVADLTDISTAPASGYLSDSLKAEVGEGYVFQILDGAVTHYAALRVTHVDHQELIFDWSVQTNPSNPELQLRGGLSTAKLTGLIVVKRH